MRHSQGVGGLPAPCELRRHFIQSRSQYVSDGSYPAAGIVLPAAEMPKALYVPYTLHHGLLTVSGQLPLRNGKPVFVGTVPDAVAVDAAQEAARLCLANLLGWVARLWRATSNVSAAWSGWVAMSRQNPGSMMPPL